MSRHSIVMRIARNHWQGLKSICEQRVNKPISRMDSLSRIEQSIIFAASDIWQAPHLFQKRNQQLWIEMDRLKKLTSTVTKVTVRAVIPESRLASYVDSPYDVDRELAYPNAADAPEPAVKVPDASEPWMLPEVDELWRKFQTPTRVIHSVFVAQWLHTSFPSLVIKCKRYDPGVVNVVELPCLELCNLKELELQLRIASTRKLWAHGLPAVPKKPNFLNPFLLRSVREWRNHVLNDVRGFPELTNLLRKTRSKHEQLLTISSRDLPESVPKIDSGCYQLWNVNCCQDSQKQRLYKDVL